MILTLLIKSAISEEIDNVFMPEAKNKLFRTNYFSLPFISFCFLNTLLTLVQLIKKQKEKIKDCLKDKKNWH